MPIDYRVDSARRVLIAEVVGRVTDDDLLAYGRALLDDPRAGEANHEFVDLRSVDASSIITSQGVRALAQFWIDAYAKMSGGRLAILAESDVSYGMARMYQSYRADGPDEIRIFRDEAEAWDWICDPLSAPRSAPGSCGG